VHLLTDAYPTVKFFAIVRLELNFDPPPPSAHGMAIALRVGEIKCDDGGSRRFVLFRTFYPTNGAVVALKLGIAMAVIAMGFTDILLLCLVFRRIL
jgi:hypothetical protein